MWKGVVVVGMCAIGTRLKLCTQRERHTNESPVIDRDVDFGLPSHGVVDSPGDVRRLQKPRLLGHTLGASPRHPPLLLHALPPPQPPGVVLPHLLRLLRLLPSPPVPPRLLLRLQLQHSHPLRGRRQVPSLPLPSLPRPRKLLLLRPTVDENGARSMDKSLSEAFLCAAKIAASSMNKAVTFYRSEAERKGKDAAVAKKRAREALEDVLKLEEKAKSAAVSKPSVDVSGNRDQKPKQSPASNGGLKQIESSAAPTTQVKKQSPSVMQVKQEK
ncbi:Uncharacterized protein Rs2_00549 [Raphanus sativus]|nr:Uncharacterized protein Rs2_00549 [Raphanus sativus]